MTETDVLSLMNERVASSVPDEMNETVSILQECTLWTKLDVCFGDGMVISLCDHLSSFLPAVAVKGEDLFPGLPVVVSTT